MNSKYLNILSGIFLIIICSFLLLFIIQKPKEQDLTENRTLKKLPALEIDHLDAYPDKYTEYFNDQFPYRPKIIAAFNKFLITVFQKSPNNKSAIIGKHGWLFTSGKYLDTYEGKNLFSKEELDILKSEMEYRWKFCNDLGAKLYFVIIPSKHTVYSEYLPLYIRNRKNVTTRTQIVKLFKDNNNVKIIDLTEFLMECKKQDQIYIKTDNHWNELGAFYAAGYILKEIKKDFPQIKIPQIDDYDTAQIHIKGGNISKLMGLKDHYYYTKIKISPKKPEKAVKGKKSNYPVPEAFPYKWEYEVVMENDSAPDLKFLMVRESFGSFEIPILQESFRKSVFIFDEWKHQLNPEIIENEKPDIVVIQILEGMLHNFLDYRSVN